MSDSRVIYDVAVIGAGPGGYVAAIRASQLGLKVCVIDPWTNNGAAALGGTCTNVGCIPSKALLKSSGLYADIVNSSEEHGLSCSNVAVDLDRMMLRKEEIIRQSNEGIAFLFKKNKIDFYSGFASFSQRVQANFNLDVHGKDECKLEAKDVIIASGSRPRDLPGVVFDEDRILSNAGALSQKTIPHTLGIIGAGVIGLELGSIWARLGSDVRILEAAQTLLPFADKTVAKEAVSSLSKQGLAMEFGVRVEEVSRDENRVSVLYTNKEGEKEEMWVERLIICIGRVPNTESLGLSNIGVTLTDRNFIEVDDECRTNVPGVWAIGDVVRGPMLAHKAEEEGVAVAERIAGGKSIVHYDLVPSVIYTEPEVAWVGKTEEQLQTEHREYRVGQFPFKANGMARASGKTEGFVRIYADKTTDEILGVHIVGAEAGELITQAVQAMSFKASAEDLALQCVPHPTLSEAVKEAALAVDRRSLNM
jgi:dihydrolipoamide dehydrogenase